MNINGVSLCSACIKPLSCGFIPFRRQHHGRRIVIHIINDLIPRKRIHPAPSARGTHHSQIARHSVLGYRSTWAFILTTLSQR
ncbi:hypothetical protein Cf24236_4261 [Citrobacter farmeri]|nr:hypothetical protein Cf24236_4261 [Citrobacter farmeri]